MMIMWMGSYMVGLVGSWVLGVLAGGLVGTFHDDNADGQLASSMVGLLVGTGQLIDEPRLSRAAAL